jgi:hypothetical protein
MNLVIKALALWGLLDSMWLAADPKAWSRFWRQGVDVIGDSKGVAKTLAGVQFAICMWLLKRR